MGNDLYPSVQGVRVPPSRRPDPSTSSKHTEPALLNYERILVEELIEHDSLCILAQGLGWQKIVSVFIRLHHYQQPGVVLILGCLPWQRDMLCKELSRHDITVPVPVEINNEITALERIEHYQSSACCFVTTRILVVDLLSARVQPRQIAGMIVLNAQRVTDSSGEGFAIRLFRSGNPSGFVRAFSDQPSAFASGFNKVEKVMKALHVRKLCLWPRFQQNILDELEACKPQVIEWEAELSLPMLTIQAAITEVLDSLIKELRRTNRIDCSDLKLENGLFKSFDEIVRRQLDPIWHTTSWKTRQIVRDLRTVRELAHFLLHYDAVTFLAYLEDLRLSEGVRCVWLFHDATHAMYEQARRRVYMLQQATIPASPGKKAGNRKRKVPDDAEVSSASAPGGASEVVPVLEAPPKWQLLRQVLLEVQQERSGLLAQHVPAPHTAPATETLAAAPTAAATIIDAADRSTTALQEARAQQQTQAPHKPAVHDDAGVQLQQQPVTIDLTVATAQEAEPCPVPAARVARRAPILVVARKLHMCQQLEKVIRDGGEAVMRELYESYVISKHSTQEVVQGHGQRADLAAIPRGRGRGQGGRGSGHGKPLEENMRGPSLRPAEQQALHVAAQQMGSQRSMADGNKPRARNSKAQRLRRKHDESPDRQQQEAGAYADDTGPGLLLDMTVQATTACPPCPLLDGMHFYALDSHDELILWELQPSFIIMYEPDLTFIRQVEVFHAERHNQPLWVHQLSHSDSLEQQAYLASVERERASFSNIIEFKQHIVIPVDNLPRNQLTAQGTGLYAARINNTVPKVAAVKQGFLLTVLPTTLYGMLSALTPLNTTTPVLQNSLQDQWLDMYNQNALTRVAGGRLAAKAPSRRLVVDVREFMSSLPAVLHQQGFELKPITLEVGDYVLSPEIVIERKSLPDLVGSLNSGRLYHQAEAMTKHYKTPVLLIEFESDKTFALQSVSDIGDDIDAKSVTSKLVLLLLHFPKLRLVWSRSPHATADMFMALKSNQDEPDPAAAALIGLPVGPDGQPLAAGVESVVNQSAVELLRRLPGVTDANYRTLMNKYKSLADIAKASLEELECIMGSSKNAKALRAFLDAPCPRQ